MTGVIDRPETNFDGPSHTYTDGEGDFLGVSTVAKMGGASETWNIASAWAFRIGYEGAWQLYEVDDAQTFTSVDTLRAALQERGLTPWATRDKAAERGNWAHEALEQLAQNGEVGRKDHWTDEVWGHVQAVYAWYLEYRPTFVATEVQVTSRTHRFAGRYDIRCKIDSRRILSRFKGHESAQAKRILGIARGAGNPLALCLVDLKTSKRVYPETHFPQLSGYEGASVEMGFPPTDAQFVLNTHDDGTYDFEPSWSTYDDFLSYLEALRSIRRIQHEHPEAKLRRAREAALLAKLPGISRELAQTVPELAGMDGRGVGILLGGMRKRGLVSQDERKVWSVVAAG